MTPARVISLSTGRGAGSALGLLGDRRLARLAAKGDPRAFAAIYERYHQDIYRYCRSITANADDASDALQSTMAAALRALRGERREVALRPWLFRIAHNESISLIRRRSSYVELTDTMGPSAPGPYAVASMREQLSGLVADLQELPERQRGALVMREMIGLEYGEIAAALNVSSGAARQAVHEARLALSQSVEGREMACDAARRSISGRDGRVLRGRKLRAHLRECRGCNAFSEQLDVRRSALPGLFPPLPVAAGVAILGGLVGGAATLGVGASVGTLGGVGSGGVMSALASAVSQAAGASAAAKGAAAAAAVAVVAGVGTVEVAKQKQAPPRDRDTVAQAKPRERPAARPAAVTPVTRRSLPSRRVRAPAPRPGTVHPAGETTTRLRTPVVVRRAPRPLQTVDPDLLRVRAPTQVPAKPAPVPAPKPIPTPVRVPVRVPPSPLQQTIQKSYDAGMGGAVVGLQAGQQAVQQALQLTQQILSGIAPLAPPR